MKDNIACISCGFQEFNHIAVNKEFYFLRDIIRCKGCGLAFVYPLPKEEEINRFYTKEYSLKYNRYNKKRFFICIIEDLYSKFFLKMRIQERFRYLLAKEISLCGKNILEIGSANGRFLNELKKKGAIVEGVEPSELESLVSINKFKITPIATTEELLPYCKGKYDILFSYHVLEHLINPSREISNIKQLLKKNGLFIGEIPFTPRDVFSLEPELIRSNFDNLHIFHFNAKSIRNLLEKAGFWDVEIERIELKSILRKICPQANVHYLHSSYDRKFIIKFFSFLHGLELSIKNFLNKSIISSQKIIDFELEWRGPNDFIRFSARA